MNPPAEPIYEPLPLNTTAPWKCNTDIWRMDNLAAAGPTSDLHLTSRRFNYNQPGEHNSIWHFHYLNSCKANVLRVMVDLHTFQNTHTHTPWHPPALELTFTFRSRLDHKQPFEDMTLSLPKHVLVLIVKSTCRVYMNTHLRANWQVAKWIRREPRESHQ